jgi:hypothetical protein
MNSIKSILFGTRIRIICTSIALVIGLYALVGFFLIPRIAKPKIVETISTITGRETTLEVLKVNPFTFSGTIEGFSITDTDGETLLSLGKAYANVQVLFFLFSREYHLKEVDLIDPYFRVRINRYGSLNIADIINQITDAQASTVQQEKRKEPRHIRVDLVRVANGTFSITDLSRSSDFTTVISPITFDINGFHTSGEADAPYAFSAKSESGESLQWEGFVALAPVRSKGSFKLNGISLPKYQPFYDIFVKTDFVDGLMNVSGKYDYSSAVDGTMRLEEASVVMENVDIVKASDQTPVMSLQAGSISGISMDYHGQSLEIQMVDLKAGSLQAKRLSNGQIDLLDLLRATALPQSDSSGAESVNEAPPAVSLNYLIHAVDLEGFSIQLIDEVTPRPALLGLEEIRVQAAGISSEPGVPVDLSLSANSNQGGSITVSGSATLSPLGADLSLAVGALHLSPANPYLAQFADAGLESGTLDLEGKASVSLTEAKPSGQFTGSLKLANMTLNANESGEAIAALTSLELAGISANLDPMSLSIGEISVVEPTATLVIDEDGNSNIATVFRMQSEEPVEDQPEEEEPTEPVAKATGLELPFPVSIGSITLDRAGALMTDRSISPSVNLGIESLSGTISGLSSEELARADLDLEGKLVGGTQLAVKGKINPLIADRYSDVEVTFKDFNLTAVSPYSGKYAGYALNKGQLSFDLKYKVSHAELSGENVMVIDQLTLGNKVESEDALKLPIPLAVSLLKDRNGVIEIDVPVSGNLNDPSFSFGRVIGRAFVNILTKLITSPFSMLGGLVSGGDDVDLSMVAFSAGEVELDQDAPAKLDLLAKALTERPNLKLEIIGAAGGPAEITTLRRLNLDQQLKELYREELKNVGRATATLDEEGLPKAERDRLVEMVFTALFPPSADAAEVSVAAPKPDATGVEQPGPSSSKERKGLLGTIGAIFTGSKNNEAKPQADPVNEETQEVTATDEAAIPEFSLVEMEDRLLENITISETVLQEIADARAEQVRAYLETTGAIQPDRLFIVKPEDPQLVSADGGDAKVAFTLE